MEGDKIQMEMFTETSKLCYSTPGRGAWAVRNYGWSNLYLRTVKINVYIFCGVIAAEVCDVRFGSVFIM